MDCQNKILIVDDSNVNRMLLRRILEDTYDIAEAENGRRALDLLSSSETRFSAVLLDILMPVMNGFDFLQLVRKDSSMSSLPVVVITEADDIDTELTALKLGATDFLKKPYEPMIIRQRLDNIIKLKAFMDNETRSEQEKVLINNIPCCVAICEISDTVKMRYISEGIENISGFSAAEFKEKFAENALASLHPRFREKLLHELIQCAEKHEPIDVEYLAFRKDGHERWTKMSGKYAGEDNGSTLYYCVLTDITANKLTETKLALNERQLRLAFDQSALEMLEYDFSTGNLKFTPNSKSNRRPISFKLESKKYARIIHTDSRQAYGKALAELKSGKSPVEVSLQMLRGHYFRWVRFSFSTVIGESGEPEKAIGVCRDITSEVEAEHKYELEASYRRALIEDALVFLEFDLSTEEVLTKNTEFVKNLDLPEGRSLLYHSKYIVQKLIHPDDIYLFEPFEHISKLSEEIKSGKSEVTIECRSRSASHIYRDYHWVSLSFSFIVNPTNDHPHMFICVRDINDSKLRQLKIIDKSQRDSLTGVYNRATFVDLTVDALIRCREEGLVSAFMIVDIDDFKVINDTHGHAIGDEVLSILGSRLRSLFRKNDIIGRLGGDEFVVFLPHIPSEELALSKGMAVCKAMASWREKISMTCSAGIAISPQFGDTFETLYANADLALYRAKMLGKNTCCLYDGESCAPILENKLDKNQLFEALDDIVHVIDVENLELLYANDRAKKAFNLPPDYVGRTCYGTLYNRSTPCPYCTNKYLSFDKFYIWEHDSSGLNSRFIVKNKLIRWSGRTARLEIAIDINNSTTRQALDDGLKQQEAIAEEKYMFLLDNTDISSFDYDALTDTMHYVSRSVGEKAAERAIPNYSEYVMSSGAIHSDDTEILIACLSSHVPNLTEGHVIIRYRQDCESFTALSVNYICLCNDSGSPYRVIGKYHVANKSDLTDADTSPTDTDSQDTRQKQTMLLANLSEDRRADLADLFRSDCAIIETYDQASTEEALNRRDDISIVLLDNDKMDKVCLDILNSISLIPRLKLVPFIVIASNCEQGDELKALELGVHDFICAPYTRETLCLRVRNALFCREDRMKLKHLLYDTSGRLQSLISSVPGGIVILNVSDPVVPVYFNDTLCSMLGMSRAELEDRFKNEISSLIYAEDLGHFADCLKSCLKGSVEFDCIFRANHTNGSHPWIHMTAGKIHIENGVPVLHAVLLDITSEKENELLSVTASNELRYNLKCDKLTGISNRDKFYSDTTKMIRENSETPYTLLLWDIERFKVVNDLFGSDVGDKILIEIADRLKEQMQEATTFGRIESDHFVTCFPKYLFSIEDLLDVMNDSFDALGVNYNLVFHVGVYEIEDTDVPVDQMCDRAGLALRTIKGNYIQRIAYYDDRMRERLLSEQEIASAMSSALDSGQFLIHLQPIFDAVTQKPTCAEALVRWNHPTKGLLPPDLFIPVFEKNEFISKIDSFVLEQVCGVIRDAALNGYPMVPISVNVSRIDLYNPELAHNMLAKIAEYGIDQSMIKVEITESAYRENTDQLLDAMNELRHHGFKISMDDFGSGYSSLNMLKDAPIDILKLDMQFIRDLESSMRAEKLVTSIIKMANLLDIKVVAEGAETKAQYSFLKAAGCDFIQGYYFSKPLTRDGFYELLKKYDKPKKPIGKSAASK